MNEKGISPDQERMIAALYGELSAEELRRFEADLERDPSLKSEFETLREARSFLRASLVEDLKPELSFSLPTAERPAGGKSRLSSLSGPWRWGLSAAAGFAAATVLFALMIFSGLRIDRSDQGYMIRFRSLTSQEASGDPSRLHPTGLPVRGTGTGESDHWNDMDRPVTRAEFEAFSRMLVETTAATIDTLERRRTDEQMLLTRELYQALSLSQRRYHDDLKSRIELVGFHSLQSRGPDAGRLQLDHGTAENTQGGFNR